MGHVDYSVRGRVAVLAFQSPPVNSLSLPLRCDLVAALDRVMADPAVDAAVLIGANGTFCAGADIREFGTPEMLRGPTIWSVNSLLDDASKPVVAAIEGVALGGGLELALSCHYRVALESARVGLPEVKLGLVPGAGGTQRLPRLIGVEGALNVMLGGEPVPAPLFAGSPLFDRLVKTDLLPAALEVAEAAAAARASGKPLPRVRDRRVVEPDLEALLQFARNTARTAFKEYPAPLAIIDAVQAAAKLPFDAGHAEESRLFRPLLDSPVSLALRHVFFAERAASRVNGLPAGTAVRNIGSVAIIGAGTKLDNLVHIAHNVRVGRGCFFAAQAAVAGSTRIGDGVQVGGQAGVGGHVTICSRANLAGGAGVIGNVPAGETWSGYPARPHRDHLRAAAAIARLAKIVRPLEQLVHATGAPSAGPSEAGGSAS